MSRIQHIKIKNFKAISEAEAEFKGCTAIVTAGNNKGKTSLLKGIVDRIRFIRPELIVKDGEESGKGEMTLTTGEKFIWEFDNKGKDKLFYVTEKGIKTSVNKELGERFFPLTFDVDKFLQSPPKKQAAQLQAILGIDFTDIDNRYAIAYTDRTEKNREAEKFHVKLSQMLKVDYVAPVDLTVLQAEKLKIKNSLNALYLQNKSYNEGLRKKWNEEKETIDLEVKTHNEEQDAKRAANTKCIEAVATLTENNYPGIEDLSAWVLKMGQEILLKKVAAELYPKEPEYIKELPDDKDMQAIDAKILTASETNSKAKAYQDYIAYKTQTEEAKVSADKADEVVKGIEEERRKLIESANFPKGISITAEGITVDDLPLDRNQISTSKLYTTALRIASMNLGEVKTLYFDASFLDRNSLGEIEKWAQENDLQLLIERPDFDGGDIKYELIETL